MNGRTCQLCGKPLSRFTVGSGGDFCSREHRNQYRLRLGMDRLQEANKVASLMRRRENAKTIPPSQLARDAKVLPRAASHMRLSVKAPGIQHLRPTPPALEHTRVVVVSRNLLVSHPAPAPVHVLLEPFESPHRILSPNTRPLLPVRKNQLQARIQTAGMAPVPVAAIPARDMRRETALPPGQVTRVRLLQAGRSIRNCQEALPAMPLVNSADRGQDLRISGSRGFRVPKVRMRSTELKLIGTNPLLNTSEARRILTACAPPETEATSTAIGFSPRNVFGPRPPHRNRAVQFVWPSALVNGADLPQRTAETARPARISWNGPAPRMLRLRTGQFGTLSLRPPASLPAGSRPKPRAISSQQRLTLVRFEPRETVLEWTPTALYGTLLGAMQFGAAPVRKQEPPPATTLEEHFAAGLRDWTGATDDWKVDVAGVRAGSLALFSPSIQMSDYTLEFLARIETRSVRWVFRAANLTDYYEATLAVAQPGGYEFRRSAVMGGAAEEPVSRPVTLNSTAPSTRSAVTLRTRVVGNEFTVSLDGQVIDTWTDPRLATGGIGFVGAPDDRARLYWVKLTPGGHIPKEYLKQ